MPGRTGICFLSCARHATLAEPVIATGVAPESRVGVVLEAQYTPNHILIRSLAQIVPRGGAGGRGSYQITSATRFLSAEAGGHF
jgi:hypothetical protein